MQLFKSIESFQKNPGALEQKILEFRNENIYSVGDSESKILDMISKILQGKL